MGRNRHNPLTPEQEKEILDRYQTTSVLVLAREMQMAHPRRIYKFLNDRGLSSWDRERKVQVRKKNTVAEGMFDISERECWFI